MHSRGHWQRRNSRWEPSGRPRLLEITRGTVFAAPLASSLTYDRFTRPSFRHRSKACSRPCSKPHLWRSRTPTRCSCSSQLPCQLAMQPTTSRPSSSGICRHNSLPCHLSATSSGTCQRRSSMPSCRPCALSYRTCHLCSSRHPCRNSPSCRQLLQLPCRYCNKRMP